MRIVILSGNVGSGIPNISQIFSKHRIKVVDCDRIAFQLIQNPSSIPSQEAIKLFGNKILNPNGTISLRAFKIELYSDPVKRKQFVDMIYPYVYRKALKQLLIRWLLCRSTVIVSSQYYFEYHFNTYKSLDLITVSSSFENQLQVLTENLNITKNEGMKIINGQIPIDFKCSMSSIVIENKRDNDENEINVSKIIKKWQMEPQPFYKRYFSLILLSILALIISFTLSF